MPSIQIEKLEIFNTLWDQEIKPNHSNFESSVVNVIEEKIDKVVKLQNVAPETRKQVSSLAQVFTSRTKSMFTSSAVCILL